MNLRKVVFTVWAAVLCALPLAGSAEGVDFYGGDLAGALARAEAERRPVMVELYATWCPACRDLDRTLRDEKVGEWVDARLVAVRYDVDTSAGRRLSEIYGVEAIPTTLLLDARGNLVGKLVGTGSPEGLVEALEQLLRNIPSPAQGR